MSYQLQFTPYFDKQVDKLSDTSKSLLRKKILEIKANPLQNKRIINSIYSIDIMATTTIAISKRLKDKLKHLGTAGDTYEDVIERMYSLTKNQLLMQYLYDTSDSIPVSQALKEAKKRWSK